MKCLIYSFVVIFSLFVNTCHSQSLCVSIDSVVVHNVPLNLRTSLALSEYDVINPSDYGYQLTVIDDSTALNQFCAIDLLAEPFDTHQSEPSIDARIVLEIYSTKSKISSMVMNSKGWYSIGHPIYRSQRLMDWLNSNVVGISLPSR